MKNKIISTFGEKIFLRPLFYQYTGGLRFELSEGGTMLEQFLRALEKANALCQYLFNDNQSIIVCLRTIQHSNIFTYREILRELVLAGIHIPKSFEYWLENDTDNDNL